MHHVSLLRYLNPVYRHTRLFLFDRFALFARNARSTMKECRVPQIEPRALLNNIHLQIAIILYVIALPDYTRRARSFFPTARANTRSLRSNNTANSNFRRWIRRANILARVYIYLRSHQSHLEWQFYFRAWFFIGIVFHLEVNIDKKKNNCSLALIYFFLELKLQKFINFRKL